MRHFRARWLCLLLLLPCCAGFLLFRFIHWPPASPPETDPLTAFVSAGIPGSEFLLFPNGNLNGWYPVGIGRWTIQDGILSIRHGIGYLATHCDTLTDFTLSLHVRTGPQANSGVFFRATHPSWDLRPWPVGYEAQVDHHDPRNPTGSLYNRHTASGHPPRDGEWFTMDITVKGPSVQIKINQEVVVSATDTTYQTGFLALQAHGPQSWVEYKDGRLLLLDRKESEEGH
ncbi:MAG: DUF1080 domain-containing protein [bacterium]|nr:DUF1080 domain-containing protein [bacterium]